MHANKTYVGLAVLIAICMVIITNMIVLGETTTHDTLAAWVGWNAGVVLVLSLFSIMILAGTESY